MIYGVERSAKGFVIEIVRFYDRQLSRAKLWRSGQARDPRTGDFVTLDGVREIYQMPKGWKSKSRVCLRLAKEIESSGELIKKEMQ